MLINLPYLIATYGYLAILVGTFLEGETILVLGGFFASQGYLSLPIVILMAFLGSFLCDQIIFHIGRLEGKKFLDHYIHLKLKAARVQRFLERNQNKTILGFRFAYGLRTITPLTLGTTKVSGKKFFILNMISAALWAVSFGIGGYFLGFILERFLGKLKNIELLILLIVLIIGCLVWLKKFVELRRKKAKNKHVKTLKK